MNRDEIPPIEQLRFSRGERVQKLFNGRDFTGWEGQLGKYWRTEPGEIVAFNSRNVPASTYLFTRKKYREFRLIFDVKQNRDPRFSTMHSAIAALGEKFTDQGDPFSFKGPLLMFCYDWGIWDANRRNRVFPPNYPTNLQHPSERVGDWNRVEMLVIGNRIRVVNNGQLVMDFTDDPAMLQPSPLGLQLHANNRPQEWRWRGLLLSERPKNVLVTQAV